jgi:6-phosphogluconolactonase
MDVEIFPGPAALAVGAADFIERTVQESGGRCDIGLAGGSTPQATYAQLRSRDIDWGSVDLWLSDERWVPHDSEDSNGHQAERTLLDGIEPATFLRPRYSSHLEPVDSAAYYEAALRSMIGTRPKLILLGMGTDGHTASLFPGTAAVEDTSDRWYVANHVPQLDTWRLTATPHLLESTERIVVIVSGGSKAEVLAEVVERPQGRYPLELLHRSSGSVTVLCDRDAASSLSG